jgi:co-chaperonin GroES (HSP10)
MIRPLCGQVVVREVPPRSSALLWTPPPQPRSVTTHTGRVLALGPPARTAAGVEVPHEYQVGDLVQYHFEHLEKVLTNPWEDGELATWVPQWCIDAVWEETCDIHDGVLYVCTLPVNHDGPHGWEL